MRYISGVSAGGYIHATQLAHKGACPKKVEHSFLKNYYVMLVGEITACTS